MSKTKPTIHDLLESPGFQYINRTHQRAFTLGIFKGNVEELERALSVQNDPKQTFEILGEDNHEAAHQFHRELARLLHNFLASAMTLVDHTRVFVDKHYLGTPVKRLFMSNVERDFAKNTLTRFVQDLRNFMVHCGLPPSQRRFTISRTKGSSPPTHTASSGFALDVAELKKWSGWKSDSKTFLKAAGERVDVTALVADYRTLIFKFYEEFDEILLNYHKDDLAHARDLEEQMRA